MKANGIDLDQLAGFAEAVQAQPDAGAVTARTTHRWDDGFGVDWQAERLTVGGETIARAHTLRMDIPKELGGGDSGPTPGETLLAALGTCVAHQFVQYAAVQGVDIDGLEMALEGRVDLRGSLDVDGVRPGLSAVTITVRVRSGADDIVLDELLRTAVRTSPIADSVAHPVALDSAVERLP